MKVDWKKKLTAEQYRVLREKGTEMAFSNEMHENKKEGVYSCAGCGKKLFNSSTKFDSGTGWPSFSDAEKNSVELKKDFKMILPRTEVLCKECGGHLGHVFNDGPAPTGKRFCINSVSLEFAQSKQ